MKRFDTELEFISVIHRDGSGVNPEPDRSKTLHNKLRLRRLSITEDTYLASDGMNVFVVRLKNPPKKR